MIQILDRVDQGIAAFDAEGRLALYNRAFAHLFEARGFMVKPGIGALQLLLNFDASNCLRSESCILRPGTGGQEAIRRVHCEHVLGKDRVVEICRSPLDDGGFVATFANITRPRRDQDAVQAREASLAEAQRIARVGSWDLNVATNEFTWSDQAYRIFGLKPQQFTPTYDDLLDAIHPEDRQSVRDAIDAALYRDAPYRIEHRIVRPDGVERIVQEAGEVTFNEAGVPCRMMGTVHDITERKLADRALAEAKERFRLAFETSPDAVSISRLEDGLYVDVNQGYTDLTGHARGDVIGKRTAQLGFWDDPEERKRIVHMLGECGSVRNQEIVVRHRNGERRKALLSAALFDLDGESHLLALTKDITELKVAEEQLRKLSQAIEQSASPVMITDAHGIIEYVNQKFTETTGYLREEVAGKTPRLLQSGNTCRRQYDGLWSAIRGGGIWQGEFENRRKDGSRFWARVSISPIRDENGTITHFVGVEEDITERKIAEEKLRASEERFRGLVEGSLLGIVIDDDGKPLFANKTFAKLFGYASPEEILALDSLDCLYARDDAATIRRYRNARRDNGDAPEEYEYCGIRKDGQEIWLRAHVRNVTWDGRPAVQSTLIDITLRKHYEQRLHHQANHDAITGLPNRTLAMDRLHRGIVRARRHQNALGVLFMDVDHFKKVNDTLGHALGDRLLQEIAIRINMCVREDDTVARVAGDEFTVILPDIYRHEDAEEVAAKILACLAKPFELDGHQVFASASIGISMWPRDAADPQDLMRKADAAMYQAKKTGRNAVSLFTPELHARAVKHARMETLLRNGLEREEFVLVYQPLVDLATGQIASAEAFLRWNSPVLGQLVPAEFIRVAEKTGLIVPMGQWVLVTACRQLRAWRDAGAQTMRMSVNISDRQFRDPAFVHGVLRALAESGLAADCLELDVSERLLVEDLPEVAQMIVKLRSHGVRFTVDDFGTGHASLSHLRRFPLDTLKIDRSFVDVLPEDASSVSVVEAIIAMAHRLDLRVVAEGVERADQLAFLRSRYCDMAQGYLLGKPSKPETALTPFPGAPIF